MNNLDKCTVLIVDDVNANIRILINALSEYYEIAVANNGQAALDYCVNSKPDLILLDIMMPGLSGYDVIKSLKSNISTQKIPVIFLTALSEIENKTRGFDLGAIDYIIKPFEISEVRARVKTHLTLVLASRFIEDQNIHLEALVKARTEELVLTRQATIEALASLAEHRDPETGGHIKRIKHYVIALGKELQTNSPYAHLVDDNYIDLLALSSPLHDIGKVGVKDSILLKPGKLTVQEFEEMKKHTLHGYEAILAAESNLGDNSFLKVANEITYFHHEKWDGSGYPRGLKGEEIPLSARIMSIADVYDALVSKRVYKEAIMHEEAVKIIASERGKHFDDILVLAFLNINKDFDTIRQNFNG